jgi:hypothetical protein
MRLSGERGQMLAGRRGIISMKRDLVFFSARTKPKRLSKVLSRSDRQAKVLLVDGEKPNEYSGFDIENLSDYLEDARATRDYHQLSMELGDEWNRRSGFCSHVMYEGYSLWWIERYEFNWWMREVLSRIDAVRGLIEEVEPYRVILVDLSQEWKDLLLCVATQFSLPVEVHESRRSLQGCSDRAASLTSTIPYVSTRGVRSLQGLSRRLRHRLGRDNRHQPKILVHTLSVCWQKLGGHTGDKSGYFDPHLGLVYLELQRRKRELVVLDHMSHTQDGLRTLLHKKYPYIPTEGYLGCLLKSMRTARRQAKVIRDSWGKSRDGLEWGMSYEGVDIGDLLEKRVAAFVTERVPSLLWGIEFYRRLFVKEGPGAIVMMAEHSTGQAVVIAARTSGIPVIAVQHGLVSERDPQYIYPRDHGGTLPLCDKTAVFGSYHRDILTTRSAYDERSIEVTGQSRLDFLKQNSSFQGVNQRAILGISEGKRVLLFTSQPGIQSVAAPLLMEGLAQLGDDYFLVVKLHPATEADMSYTEAAGRYRVGNFTVLKHADVYELLRLCDLHISVWSSVLSEAVIFDKPNLTLGIAGFPDVGGWEEQGVALNLKAFTSFQEAVEKILGDETIREQLRTAREAYVRRHYHQLDGRATERICDGIESSIKEEMPRDQGVYSKSCT